ncbi:ABC transporter ATP-binding protein [Streptacidiphilus sp. PAMC 29251]
MAPRRATAGTGPAVTLQGVTKRYGELTAVDDVSLTVQRGEMFGVLGPNGAGKTTLIEMMEGLRSADAGTVSILGLDPWPRNRALLPQVGVQSQAAAFFTRLTTIEHLETVAALYRMPRARAYQVLEQVGLTEKAGTRVEQLSGGQRQRLGIASALTHDPQLLFLDEPTAALDPQARRDLWRLLREIRDQGRTIVYTTHHIDEAEALCDRVAIMRAGRVIAVDRPRTLVEALDEPLRLLVPSGRISAEDARTIVGVDSATDEGDQLVIATRTLVPVLSAVSERAGSDGISTRAPSLEDVYFRLTGLEFTV